MAILEGVSEPVESPAPAPRSAATRRAAGATDGAPASVRSLPRDRSRRRAGAWAKVGMALFAVGLVAIVVIVVLFASGGRDLPVWLNVTAMLAPVGLGVGLLGVFREARRPARTARAADRA